MAIKPTSASSFHRNPKCFESRSQRTDTFSPCSPHRDANPRNTRNRQAILTLFKRTRYLSRRDVRFAAIESRRVQRFGFHRAASSRAKVQRQRQILVCILVQNNQGNLAARKLRSISSR